MPFHHPILGLGLDKIALERRNDYPWYSHGSQRAVEAYATWSPIHLAITYASNHQ